MRSSIAKQYSINNFKYRTRSSPNPSHHSLQEWKPPPLRATKGTLYKYIQTVATASEGCVTDEYDGESLRLEIEDLKQQLADAKAKQ